MTTGGAIISPTEPCNVVLWSAAALLPLFPAASTILYFAKLKK
jgi:hypothetical protein